MDNKLNSISSASTNDDSSTNVEGEIRLPNLHKTDVACCISSIYKQVETDKEITMSNSKSIMSPVATLKNDYGSVCQIINDDHCYVICLKQEDGTYKPTTHIFKEAFEVLLRLPNTLAYVGNIEQSDLVLSNSLCTRDNVAHRD